MCHLCAAHTKLTASDGIISDDVGYSGGISGNTVVGGAPNFTMSGHVGRGSTYVFSAF